MLPGVKLMARDGIELSFEQRQATGARAKVVIVHGYAEHGGRYADLVAELIAARVDCCLPDLRGHGQSGGRSAHVNNFDNYLDDLGRVIGFVRDEEPRQGKLFLLGHSLGGLIALAYLLGDTDSVSGLVLSSPYLKPAFPISKAGAVAAEIAARVIPILPFPIPLRGEGLSHDPVVVASYENDPLVRRSTTAGWFVEVEHAQRRVLTDATRLRLPVLMLLGGEDPVADASTSREFFQRLEASHKQLIVYDHSRHEVLNETNREVVFGDVVNWLVTQSSAA
jgi:alpha-beta hydrolase superfamily lysophospholipase